MGGRSGHRVRVSAAETPPWAILSIREVLIAKSGAPWPEIGDRHGAGWAHLCRPLPGDMLEWHGDHEDGALVIPMWANRLMDERFALLIMTPQRFQLVVRGRTGDYRADAQIGRLSAAWIPVSAAWGDPLRLWLRADEARIVGTE